MDLVVQLQTSKYGFHFFPSVIVHLRMFSLEKGVTCHEFQPDSGHQPDKGFQAHRVSQPDRGLAVPNLNKCLTPQCDRTLNFGRCQKRIIQTFSIPKVVYAKNAKVHTWTFRIEAFASGIIYNCCIHDAI